MAKNKCSVEKTKGSDSYAISSAIFTTEAIATPAVLDTCTAGTMEHDKHPLTIYCSVQAATPNWNWWQLQFLSCCINAISTKPAMHLTQASICQRQNQCRQSGLLPPLPNPSPKTHQYSTLVFLLTDSVYSDRQAEQNRKLVPEKLNEGCKGRKLNILRTTGFCWFIFLKYKLKLKTKSTTKLLRSSCSLFSKN